jgi:ribosome biogenesis GTPase
MMPGGYMIIDTPGMRELGMMDADDGLGEAFADVDDLTGKCRFSDCRHASEPGCAVKQALAEGSLSRDRWDNYLRLKQETAFSDDKAAYIKGKNERFKNIAKWSKQIKKI